MKMSHLAIGAKDVPACARFYRDYFGFRTIREGAEGGFLVNEDGFVLVIEEVEDVPELPPWFHYGFYPATHDEVRALFDRMKADGVRIAEELSEQGRFLVFFCLDPEGYRIEIRA
jgi:catechol 2,3-dioxygenase-like lactoylglutathione lyase family enzyme